jgi:hypothetical protein
MPNEPSPESIARAAWLRAQIDKITKPGATDSGPPSAAPEEKTPMSPHEFIEREMDKLNRQK